MKHMRALKNRPPYAFPACVIEYKEIEIKEIKAPPKNGEPYSLTLSTTQPRLILGKHLKFTLGITKVALATWKFSALGKSPLLKCYITNENTTNNGSASRIKICETQNFSPPFITLHIYGETLDS